MGGDCCECSTFLHFEKNHNSNLSGTWSSFKIAQEARAAIYRPPPRILKRSVPTFLNPGSYNPMKTCVLAWLLSEIIHHRITLISRRILAFLPISAKYTRICPGSTLQEVGTAQKRSLQRWRRPWIWNGGCMLVRWWFSLQMRRHMVSGNTEMVRNDFLLHLQLIQEWRPRLWRRIAGRPWPIAAGTRDGRSRNNFGELCHVYVLVAEIQLQSQFFVACEPALSGYSVRS